MIPANIMQSSTNKPPSCSIAWLIAFFVATLALTPSATVCAQSSSAEYERALEDSLIIFELLKPTHRSLKRAYHARGEESNALRSALRLAELRHYLQVKDYERRIIAMQKKRQRGKKWRRIKLIAAFGMGGFLLLR